MPGHTERIVHPLQTAARIEQMKHDALATQNPLFSR
jgi:hypothetical protein